MMTSVLGTRNLLDLAESSGARFLLASTSEVYGDPEVHPQRESYWGNVNPTGPRACYDEGKRAAEALSFDFERAGARRCAGRAHLQHLRPAHARPTTAAWSPTSICQALAGDDITVYGDGAPDPLLLLCRRSGRRADAPDAPRRPQPGPVNLGNPTSSPISDSSSACSP